MTSLVSAPAQIHYPSSDGEPLAETYDHLYAILSTLEVLKQYLKGQQATVLADQYLYYAQGLPRLRIAPDVMVIFGVEPGGRDNYKIWEEGQIPRVIFEITSESTRNKDTGFKYSLYEQLGVEEYWLFDPRGEWIPEQLRGYRLQNDTYTPILDQHSTALSLRLSIEDTLITFYRDDTGDRLPLPDELADALTTAVAARLAAEQQAEAERQRAEQAEQETLAAQQRIAELEAQLQAYRDRLGEA